MDEWHSLNGKELNSIAFICPEALGKPAHFPVHISTLQDNVPEICIIVNSNSNNA